MVFQLKTAWNTANQTLSDTFSFHTWSIFQKAFPEQIDHHHQFHAFETEAWSLEPVQLPSLVDRLAKLDITMLTFLSIRNFSLTLDHLMTLTKIQTLAGLVIEQHKKDRARPMPIKIVRDWGRAALETGAFKKLRLLVFYNFCLGKDAVLQPLSSFPALSLVGVHDYRHIGDEIRDPCEDWCAVNSEW